MTSLLYRTVLAGFLAGAGIALAGSPPSGLTEHAEPRALPAFSFHDGDGQALTLADFRGRTVVLNIWATWCPPCREEMPTLDALEQQLGSERFEVVALSVDRAGPEVVRAFYREIGIEHLRLYIDASMSVMGRLGIAGVPTTLVIDPDGREIARLVGATDWASAEMVRYFCDLIDASRVMG